MSQLPYSLVSIRVWRKTRNALKKLVELRGGSMVSNLNDAVQSFLIRSEREAREGVVVRHLD